ncbi:MULTISPECIES: LysR family transcriptional regulator [Actinomycetes]|uniref:LysR family transcriptional regulator n=2 Tax=Actinomycetes TaxID=1760 RepID=A0ABP6LXB6_9MICC
MMDLNLIRVFVTVYEEGTVTAAASRLHMSQPSVTHALNRLRRETGDALFVREGRGIVPTRAAVLLYEEMGDFPAKAEAAVSRLSAFDPQNTRETFRLALTDVGQLLFLPTLIAELSAIAPLSKVDVVNLDVDTAPGELEEGQVDLAVSSTHIKGALKSTTVRTDSYCCVARRSRFGFQSPTLDELASLPRVIAKNSIGHTLVESLMPPPAVGSVLLPAFSAIPAIVATTELVAYVPLALVEMWSAGWDLDAWALPRESFTATVRAHTAAHPTSPAGAWFAQWAVEELRAIPPPQTCPPEVEAHSASSTSSDERRQ